MVSVFFYDLYPLSVVGCLLSGDDGDCRLCLLVVVVCFLLSGFDFQGLYIVSLPVVTVLIVPGCGVSHLNC
jgi:hypothetical protein